MASFVHLAPEKASSRIHRNGIRRSRTRYGVSGVYALPVLANYFTTHQWLRELKRNGQRTIVAVHFRLPDEEPVLVGHYGSEQLETTAAQATDLIAQADDPRGYRVLVPRRIDAAEIRKIRHVSQVIGWRYWPDSHGTPPCPCPVCLLPGGYGAARIRRREEL